MILHKTGFLTKSLIKVVGCVLACFPFTVIDDEQKQLEEEGINLVYISQT